MELLLAIAVLALVPFAAFKILFPRSRIFEHLFAMFVHDVLTAVWRLLFRRGRGREHGR